MSTQTTPLERLVSASPEARRVSLSGWLLRLQVLVRRWQHRAVTRRHLQQLPAHLYRDIGLRPDQIQREVQRCFWQ